MLQLVAVMMVIAAGWRCLPTVKCAFEHVTLWNPLLVPT